MKNRSLIIYVFLCFASFSLAQDAKFYYDEAVRFRYTESEPDSAIYYFEKSAELRQKAGDWKAYFEAHNRIARVLFQSGRKLESIEKGEEIIVGSRGKLGPDNYEEADAYIGMGLVYSKLGQDLAAKLDVNGMKKANECFASSIKIFEKLKLPMDELLADCYFLLAYTFDQLEQWNKALPVYYTSLSYFEERFKTDPNGKIPTRFSIENNIGEVYTKTGHYEKAEKHLQQSLFFLELWYPEKKWTISQVYHHLGTLNESMKRTEKARLYYQTALDLGLQHTTSKNIGLAPLYNSLSTICNKQKQYEEALSFSQKAFTFVKLPSHSSYEKKVYIAILDNLAETFLGLKNYERSLQKAKEALAFKAEFLGEEHYSRAINYQQIGRVYMENENYDSARAAYFKAASLLRSFFGPHHPDLAQVYNAIVESFVKESLHQDALQYTREALLANFHLFSPEKEDYFSNPPTLSCFDGIEALKSLELKAKVLLRQAKKSKNQAQSDAALASIEKADSLIFKLRSFFKGDDQITFNQLAHRVFEGAINTCYFAYQQSGDKKYVEKAFHYAESARQYALLAEINAAEALEISGLSDSLIEQEQFLRLDISFWERQLWKAEEEGLPDRISYCRNLILEEKEAYEKLMQHLEKEYPDYYRLKNNFATIDLKDAIHLLNEDQALLEYFVGESSFYVFLIAQGQVDMLEFNLPTNLKRDVRQFNNAASNLSFVRDSTALARFVLENTGHHLFQNLVYPVLKNLPETTKRLIIIPDGILHVLPFELLPVRESAGNTNFRDLPYLLRDYAITYWASATLNMRQGKRKKNTAQFAYGGFAPQYHSFVYAEGQKDYLEEFENNAPPPLPYAIEEVRVCNEMLEGEVYIGENASKANFLSSASRYKILHLAMHGFINHEEPLQSFLLFTQTDSINNGRLFTHELYNAKIPSELVVLNACNTGTGVLRKGEGIMNMARAFSLAGCPSIVMSMWSIPDASSSELTKSFFKHLKNSLPKDVALQRAKLEFLKNTVPHRTHPVHWAGIILVGDQDIIFEKNTRWWAFGVLFLSILIIAFKRSFPK